MEAVVSVMCFIICVLVCGSFGKQRVERGSMPRAGAFMLALAVVLLAAEWAHASYIDPGDEDLEIGLPDYGEDPADLQLLQDVGKRACIRRGGNCDHRPGDCCHSSSCRCNLWGSNCRCQRMGLFQKWG